MLDNASRISVSGCFIYVLYTLPTTPTFILCLHAVDGLDADKDCKNLGKLYIWQSGTMMTQIVLGAYLYNPLYILHCSYTVAQKSVPIFACFTLNNPKLNNP